MAAEEGFGRNGAGEGHVVKGLDGFDGVSLLGGDE